jgi:hypothetical protein
VKDEIGHRLVIDNVEWKQEKQERRVVSPIPVWEDLRALGRKNAFEHHTTAAREISPDTWCASATYTLSLTQTFA